MTYRILVTGSRTWDDEPLLCLQLGMAVQDASTPSDVVIVHGACPRGADDIADRWARNHGLRVERHPAEWDRHGKAAGFMRNRRMVGLGADICLAFIRDGSPGATHCKGLAEAANIPVRTWTP